jgi:hypothetical protein
VYRDPEEIARAARAKRHGHRDPSVPDERPIAWREGRRRCAYALRHPARSFFVLLLPVAYPVSLFALITPAEGAVGLLSALLYLMWVVAALLIVVVSAGAIPAERTSQTLDILLTTPLRSSRAFAASSSCCCRPCSGSSS